MHSRQHRKRNHAPVRMRKAMKPIDADSSDGPATIKSPDHTPSFISHHHPIENGFSSPTTSRDQSKKELHEITMDETYQLGIEHKEDNEIYLLDFVDSLQVSYPVHLSTFTTEALEEIPPYFHDGLFDDNLPGVASDVLRELSTRLESWMDALDDNAKQQFVSRHMLAYDQLTVIRRQVFTLIKLFVPNPNLNCGFDCTTADLDRLLDRLIVEIGNHSSDNQNRSPKFPIVSICTEPEHCVELLQKRVLALLKIILPGLTIPKYFDLTRDLPDLINAIYSYNKQTL